MKKTLGGDRLGSGNKMKVDLHGYERSTHNLGYLFRSTMSAGTLVPCIVELGLPGDTFDIDLEMDIKTHPTVGPLFGSYKAQLDVFLCPIRLYQGQLNNNKLGIGMNMAAVKLPVVDIEAYALPVGLGENIDNKQINPSCILSYLGIRGIGNIAMAPPSTMIKRQFNGLPLLAYWDIYKNYYANKQEEKGAVIHTELATLITTVDDIEVGSGSIPTGSSNVGIIYDNTVARPISLAINYTGALPVLNQIIIFTDQGNILLSALATNLEYDTVTTTIRGIFNLDGNFIVYGWDYVSATNVGVGQPTVKLFDLSQIDEMRESILTSTANTSAFNINAVSFEPWNSLLEVVSNQTAYRYSQEGLALKTYQSDMFNNWLNEEWVDGTNGINEITAIDTTGGFFTLDTLVLSKKIYNMLNRIAVSGGSYDDWMDVNWDHERFRRASTPMYMGGLIKELVFQEVVSNSESGGENGVSQPIGTLAGKGVMSNKNKGGSVTVKVDEPSYIIGLVSLTPRIDYSQGNKWDIHLKTMADLHVPAMDEIGFQDLITEQMAWWDTYYSSPGTGGYAGFTQKSAGKQPAWLNYMTNVNRVFGNFADVENEMFMTLNRRYEYDNTSYGIKDLTTYIDPVKFNYSFAQTALDAQNFWTQISVDMTARRKMSAKLMPNL